MSQIRITKTPELDQILLFLKTRWPLMDEVEIVKMAISQFFKDQQADFSTLESELLTEDQSKDIGISRKQIKAGKSVKYNSQQFLKEILS